MSCENKIKTDIKKLSTSGKVKLGTESVLKVLKKLLNLITKFVPVKLEDGKMFYSFSMILSRMRLKVFHNFI